ncbi:hypothetical protein DWU98_13195 [Dyella monticola]|uniref:Uncharacterized protein n=1 Tax=Dyella monticola TaxID=1927958 RepID=A0A370WXM0_9GAMM|nr:hypothetical protein [Dyella monticola]RDS80884.1 hypothetical protein DWU98_13195 [Dyella monticola]
MPVELPTAQWDTTPPALPRPIAWAALFVVVMLAGAASTLLMWPEGESTHTTWFWLRLLVFPALAWCLLFGLRWLYHEQEEARLHAEDEALAADRANALHFAQEPLAVLDARYLCAMGYGGVAAKIAAGQSQLESREPISGGTSVRHTTLDMDGLTQEDRFQSCFAILLRSLAVSLAGLPRGAPLSVYLQLPATAPHDDVLKRWQQSWRATECHCAETTLLTSERGIMELDAWLDIRGGPQLERFVLFVAVQLHEKAEADSAEAAVALLLGWAPFTAREGLTPQALLHRPVEDTRNSTHETLSQALLWGNTDATKVESLWHAGLGEAKRSALTQASSDMSLAVSPAETLGGTHDIDVAMGQAGVASAWLALALAVEHASHTQTPQLVASRQNTLCAAVVQPAAASQE